MMLVASLEWSLGIPASKRDANQIAIVSFIGEVLARRDAEIATRIECFEADVSCVQHAADEHAESHRKVESEFLEELRFVKEKRSVFDEEDKQRQQARDLADAAENARSQCEADLLAVDLERDLCQAANRLVKTGADSNDFNTQKLTEVIAMMQKVATKLGLEQSLVLTLPFMAKKAMHEWSMLERTAAKMIEEGFAKNLVELQGQLDAGSSTMKSHAATLEQELAKLKVVEERSDIHKVALAEAEEKYQAVESRLKAAKQAAKHSSTELKKAQDELRMALNERDAFRAGPLETFLALHGSPAVERSAKVEITVECLAPQQMAQVEVAKMDMDQQPETATTLVGIVASSDAPQQKPDNETANERAQAPLQPEDRNRVE